jgi:hypothetical protein
MTSPLSFEAPRSEMRKEEHKYFLGLDLGQSNDSTALAVVRRARWLRTSDLSSSSPAWEEERPTVFQTGFLERLPLGTTYPAIVNYVARLLQRPVWAGNIDLVIDQTGVGRPVCDLFTSAGIPHIAVTITGGDGESRDGKSWRVPKMQLVSGVQALLHEGRLHIQKDLPEAANLVRELQDFRVGFTAAGHMTFNAREGKHDDLVLALALAVWRSRKRIIKPRQILGGVIAMRDL